MSSSLPPLGCPLSLCCVQIPAGVAYPRSHHSTAGRNALKRSQTSAPGDIFLFLYLYIQLHLYIYLYPMQMSRYIERHRHLPQIIYHYAHRAAYTHLYIFLYSYLYRNLYARKTPVSLCHRLCLEIVALQRSSPRVVSLHPVRNTPPVLLLASPSFPLFSRPWGRGLLSPGRLVLAHCPAPICCFPTLPPLSNVLSPHNANLGVLAEPHRSNTVARSAPPSVPSAGGIPMRLSCVCACRFLGAADCPPVIGELMHRVSLHSRIWARHVHDVVSLPGHPPRRAVLPQGRHPQHRREEVAGTAPHRSARGLLWYHTGWADGWTN